MMLNNKERVVSKEASVAQCNVLSACLCGGTEDNSEILCSA
jgi:hypothetical protein